MQIDRNENPEFLNDYLTYITVVKGLAVSTVQVYYQDIRQFLRFLVLDNSTDAVPAKNALDAVEIRDMTIEEVRKITLRDIHNYYSFLASECGNRDKIRVRKATSLRSFFRYLTKQAALLDYDPTTNLELSRPKHALPKYLNLTESLDLLKTATSDAEGKHSLRDYCMLTLFLNCGVRLGELVGLNLSSLDLEEARMRVLGKGNKERIVYLNAACMSALKEYLFERTQAETDDPALFLSNRNTRISRRRVQQTVENALKAAGLGGRGLSTHKLRHTAATLMYQHGHVDVLTLKSILGHESISTTEIYTHLSDTSVQEAMDHAPLADVRRTDLK
ncbi:MAG: tyrosine-type recombinase/integrase [Oscillospiraceae bacterium]|nr:tyrosine-type recombinase/integrase [Oscillospiraceae bacterium]